METKGRVIINGDGTPVSTWDLYHKKDIRSLLLKGSRNAELATHLKPNSDRRVTIEHISDRQIHLANILLDSQSK